MINQYFLKEIGQKKIFLSKKISLLPLDWSYNHIIFNKTFF